MILLPYHSGMEIRQLRYFLALAQELNFTKAATRANVAQPALSRQIHKLENELGTALVDRTSRRVQRTWLMLHRNVWCSSGSVSRATNRALLSFTA